MQLVRRFGVDRPQKAQNGLVSLVLRLLTQAFTQPDVFRALAKVDIVNQRVEIKTCSADYYRGFAARGDVGNVFARHRDILRNGKLYADIDNIHHMMRYALHFCFIRFCGADADVFIYLHGIAGDYFSVELLCQPYAVFCFSGSRRSDHGKESNFFHNSKRHISRLNQKLTANNEK